MSFLRITNPEGVVIFIFSTKEKQFCLFSCSGQCFPLAWCGCPYGVSQACPHRGMTILQDHVASGFLALRGKVKKPQGKGEDMDYRRLTKAELIEMLELRERPIQVKNPATIYDYLRPYGNKEQEHFLVIALNGSMKIKAVKLVTMGLINRTLVHPREVFAPLLEMRATSCVVAHNHPSRNLEPSSEDLDLTSRLRKAGQLLGIEVLDHIIFSDIGFHSMAEAGELY